MAARSRCDLTRDLQAKVSRARDQLLVFIVCPGQDEPTNNGSERLLRPTAVQRKGGQRLTRHVGRKRQGSHSHPRRHRAHHRQQRLQHRPQNYRRVKPAITGADNYTKTLFAQQTTETA